MLLIFRDLSFFLPNTFLGISDDEMEAEGVVSMEIDEYIPIMYLIEKKNNQIRFKEVRNFVEFRLGVQREVVEDTDMQISVDFF